MFDGLFIYQHISTSIFFWTQKYFIKIILAWEIIITDKFWFNQNEWLKIYFLRNIHFRYTS